ncbi:DUF6134 family protein [Marinobacterium sp. xm-d-579]|uniref:DUF6134 family protein n=1 Tax=Marinobacterium sp. xm-d-579 TaxID=2497734 RepID=UPI001568C07D|nr:DUF6134 family protein [Marinobacterium sp. xm-d-579]
MMLIIRQSVFVMGLFLAPILNASQLVGQAKLYPEVITYDVYRKGEPVGHYTLRFSDITDDRVAAEIEMELTAKVFVFFNYEYRYQAKEVWQNDRLMQLNVKTVSNKKESSVTAVQKSDVLETVDKKGRVHAYPAELMTTHHWYRQILDQRQVLNSITGNMDEISPESVGSALLDARGETVQLDGYRLGGDLDRTVSWYDRDGRWRALEFKAKDGSDIQVIWNGGQLIKETSLAQNRE